MGSKSVKKGGGKERPARRYVVNSSISLKQVKLKDLLGHIETKRSLTQFLMAYSKNYFNAISGVSFIIAENGETHSGTGMQRNNHEEGDTLYIPLLCVADVNGKTVVAHANEADIFVLLLRHLEKIDCKVLYMRRSATESISITAAY